MNLHEQLRIAYTSDTHGNTAQYAQFLELASAYQPDLIILGGDLLPWKRRHVNPAIVDQREYLVDTLVPMLAAHRRTTGADIALLMGNDDVRVHEEQFEELCASARLLTLQERSHSVRGWQIFGNSCCTWTPFRLKDHECYDLHCDEKLRPDSFDYRDPDAFLTKDRSDWYRTLAMRLEEMAGQIRDWSRAIAVIYQPPFGGILDRMAGNQFVGSHAVRRFLKRYGPRLSTHGHIHESPSYSGCYWTKIGNTISIQPGQEEVRLHAVTLDTADIKGTLRHTVFGSASEEKNAR